MQTEELLTGVHGQLHELLGDHRAFKRETLDRLSALEKEVRSAPGARTARLCAIISALSGVMSLLANMGIRLAATAGILSLVLPPAAAAAGGAS